MVRTRVPVVPVVLVYHGNGQVMVHVWYMTVWQCGDHSKSLPLIFVRDNNHSIAIFHYATHPLCLSQLYGLSITIPATIGTRVPDVRTVHVCFRGPSPQDVALRGVMQALVRIQAYMLADIVAAIPAVDLAIEAVVRAVARV